MNDALPFIIVLHSQQSLGRLHGFAVNQNQQKGVPNYLAHCPSTSGPKKDGTHLERFTCWSYALLRGWLIACGREALSKTLVSHVVELSFGFGIGVWRFGLGFGLRIPWHLSSKCSDPMVSALHCHCVFSSGKTRRCNIFSSPVHRRGGKKVCTYGLLEIASR